jgi:hypothetical protein
MYETSQPSFAGRKRGFRIRIFRIGSALWGIVCPETSGPPTVHFNFRLGNTKTPALIRAVAAGASLTFGSSPPFCVAVESLLRLLSSPQFGVQVISI